MEKGLENPLPFKTLLKLHGRMHRTVGAIWWGREKLEVTEGLGGRATSQQQTSVRLFIHLCHRGDTCPGREGLLGSTELFPVYFDVNVLQSGLVLTPCVAPKLRGEEGHGSRSPGSVEATLPRLSTLHIQPQM